MKPDSTVPAHGQFRAVFPDVDIWMKAFSRHKPDPLVVHAFKLAVERRQVFMLGLVRQALLARTSNERQLSRLSRVLGGFPDVPIQPSDHVAAARRIQEQRTLGQTLSPWQALFWSVAERADVVIWSAAPQWSPLIAAGCPASASIAAAS